ncbi:TonB-dependent receptor [Geobacter sp. FeAm09]|uniref:TonB-dependent receptor plug domain-containing protein n=1 Tax=Geobacter sp. FeAm09 TaxID=2597769 RepID=UPI0011F02FFF|nr:TonB-dependent receptor [Geobacter sp. FeAm09]QEM68965.1 TonB-dependent receptor [Geobacter sp. FeAm09]
MKRSACRTVSNGIVGAAAAMCVMAAFAMPVSAEDKEVKNDENGNVFTLGKVEVGAKADKQKNSVVSTVGEEEMLQFDTKNIGQAANLISGVTASVSGKRGESGFNVRGFDNRRTPIYLDGIPLYVPYDGYIDTGRFMTYDLSEIDISKGFASVLYGPNTLGGAVNMVSKRPTKTFEGNAGAGYTSGDAYHAFANLGTNQKSWYLQGGGSWVDVHSFTLSDDFKATALESGDRRKNSYQRDGKASIKVGFTPNSTDEYALSYIYQHGEKGVPPYAGSNSNSISKATYWQWPWWDKQSVYLSSNTAIAEKSYVKTRIYYDQFKNSLNQYASDYATLLTGSYSPSRYDDYTVGTSIEAGTTLIPYNTLKMAFHFKDDVHRDVTTVTPESRYEDRTYSVGVEDTIDFTKKLSAVVGIGYDKLTGVEAHKYDSNSKAFLDIPLADRDALSPQATLFYTYSDTGKIHASVAMKTRFPSIKERTTASIDGSNLPNPGLKPETSINYELGVQDTVVNLVKVKSNFFVDAISDYIASVNTGILVTNYNNKKVNQTQNRNTGRVNRYGYEFEALAPIGDTAEAGFNYTFIYNDNLSSSDNITDIPKHKLFAYGKVSPIKQLSVLASVEYDTKRFSSTDGSTTAREFVVVNTKVGYEVIKDGTLEAGINNLLDRNYSYSDGYPEPGRTYFVQARYRF